MPLALSFAKELVSRGNTVLVFGQELDAIEQMENVGAIAATALKERKFETATQADFFDMVLMSRCAKIYARQASAFANLATLIGSAKHVDPIQSRNRRRLLRRIDRESAKNLHCSSLQISHAYKMAYYDFAERLSKKDRTHALARALEFDPENRLYRLSHACIRIVEGQLANADQALRSLFEADFVGKCAFPSKSMQLLNKHGASSHYLETERKTLINNMGKGFGYIDMYATYILCNGGLLDQDAQTVSHRPLRRSLRWLVRKFKSVLRRIRFAVGAIGANRVD